MDVHRMIAVVQDYINHRKGIEVDININQFQNPINLLKLKEAYEIAIDWFNDNNGKIILK